MARRLMSPRMALAVLRRLVPGRIGEALAIEVSDAFRRDLAARGALYAYLACWREVLAPSVWTLRAEIRRTPVRSSYPRSGDPFMLQLLNEFRLAVRALAKRPGFAATAVAITAVGIGASATIFTVVDHVMLRPLPYEEPEALVSVDHASHSVPLYLAWRDGSRGVFAHFAAASNGRVVLTAQIPRCSCVGLR